MFNYVYQIHNKDTEVKCLKNQFAYLILIITLPLETYN